VQKHDLAATSKQHSVHADACFGPMVKPFVPCAVEASALAWAEASAAVRRGRVGWRGARLPEIGVRGRARGAGQSWSTQAGFSAPTFPEGFRAEVRDARSVREGWLVLFQGSGFDVR